MNHRSHMIPYAIVAVIAIGFLVSRGSSPFGAGLGLVLLLCPLVMGTMMWLMMRQPGAPAPRSESHRSQLSDDRQPAPRGPHP